MTRLLPVMKLRSIVKSHGGKGSGVGNWILGNMVANYPDLKYFEPFGGGGNILLNKEISPSGEVYNEIHPKIANIFYCCRHYPEEFIQLINQIDYNEVNFKDAFKIDFEYGSVKSAVAETVIRRMSRGGLGTSFSWSDRTRGGNPGDVNAWLTFKELLPKIINRLSKVEIMNRNAIDVIKEYAHEEKALWYCDPPYVHSTRTAINAYDYEMSDEDHRLLGENLKTVKGKVIISGYDSKLYQELFKGWRCVCKSVKNNAGQGDTKSSRIECLWINY